MPLSTAYSLAEARGRPADLDDASREARLFYVGYGVRRSSPPRSSLIPGVPLVPLLYLSQALNAVLLLAILPFIRDLARDPDVMGEHRLGPSLASPRLRRSPSSPVSVLVLAWLTIS